MSNVKPLAGKRILITRAREQSKRFSEQIETYGGIPVVIPLITIQLPADKTAVIAALKQIETFHWLIFTSQNGVKSFFSVAQAQKIPFDSFEHVKIAVVGKSTEHCLRRYGFEADIVPDGEFTAESLAEKLVNQIQTNERVLFARGDLARDVLIKTLQNHGIDIVDVVVYENTMNRDVQADLIQEITNHRIDAVTFTSPSTVSYFVEMLEDIDWKNRLKDTCFAAIGPITEQAMLRLGIEPDVVAKKNTAEGLVSALIEYFQHLH